MQGWIDPGIPLYQERGACKRRKQNNYLKEKNNEQAE